MAKENLRRKFLLAWVQSKMGQLLGSTHAGPIWTRVESRSKIFWGQNIRPARKIKRPGRVPAPSDMVALGTFCFPAWRKSLRPGPTMSCRLT